MPRRRVSVGGEALITAGVFVMLFLGWPLWRNAIIAGNQKPDEAVEISQECNKGEGSSHGMPQDPPVAAVATVATTRIRSAC